MLQLQEVVLEQVWKKLQWCRGSSFEEDEKTLDLTKRNVLIKTKLVDDNSNNLKSVMLSREKE